MNPDLFFAWVGRHDGLDIMDEVLRIRISEPDFL
jgi:hypothetical protein